MLRGLLLFIMLSSTSISHAVDVKTYIPSQAHQYLSYVSCEAERLLPEITPPAYFASLIEHESCIHLKHSKCWNPKSRLKTSREEGAGMGQLTKAFRKDGRLRFDTLTELSKKYSSELKELSWNNVYDRPDLQIRAIMLLSKNNHKQLYAIKEPFQRLAMTDAAYNGGLGGVFKDRRLCGLTKDCNPLIWFNHVEKTCSKSKKILYGNRNACDINRHHVKDVLKTRLEKYKPLMLY